MPHRTNQLQRVIASIHSQLDSNAIVTESKMLRELTTENEREVDIVIEASVGDCNTIVSVECTARSRPASVEWVERMWAKHSNLPTDKLVLVSKSGYYRPALVKAKQLNIDTFTLEQAKDVDWTAIVNKVHRVILQALDARTFVLAESKKDDIGEASITALSHEQLLFTSNEEISTTVAEVVDAVLASKKLNAHTIDLVDEDEEKGFAISLSLAPGTHTITAEGNKLEISMLHIMLEAVHSATPIDLTAGSYKGYQVAFGESEGKSGNLLLTIIEDEKSKSVSLTRRLGNLEQTVPLAHWRDRLSPASDEIMKALITGSKS
jgi:hypothetical protein